MGAASARRCSGILVSPLTVSPQGCWRGRIMRYPLFLLCSFFIRIGSFHTNPRKGKRPGSYDFCGKRRSRAGPEEAAARGAYKAAVFVHSPNVRFEHCCVAGSLSVAAMPRLIAEFTSRALRQLLGHRTSVPRASVRGHLSCALCIALPSIPERNLRSMPMTWHAFACATVHYIQTHLS